MNNNLLKSKNNNGDNMIYISIFILKCFESFMSTISTIYVVNGNRLKASLFGFIQVIFWFIIIKNALDDNNYFIAVTYAGGYSIGTYLGSLISTKISKRKLFVQIITNNKNILKELKKQGYSGSITKSTGLYGQDNFIIYSVINNKRKNELINIINKIDKNCFIVINENKEIINGFFKNSNII